MRITKRAGRGAGRQRSAGGQGTSHGVRVRLPGILMVAVALIGLAAAPAASAATSSAAAARPAKTATAKPPAAAKPPAKADRKSVV